MKTIVLGARPDHTSVCEVLVDPEAIWTSPTPEKLDAHRAAVDAETPDDSPLGVLRFYIRPFTGEDQREFSDRMMVSDRKGRSKMHAGEVQRAKVLRGVVKIEGLTNDRGKPIDRMSPVVYAEMPAWITNKIVEKINEDMLEEEEEESGN